MVSPTARPHIAGMDASTALLLFPVAVFGAGGIVWFWTNH